MLLNYLFQLRDHASAPISVNSRDLKGRIAFLVSVTPSDAYAWRSIDCFIYYGNIAHWSVNFIVNLLSWLIYHLDWWSWICYCLPNSIYLLKVNNFNSKARCEICSKLAVKTQERRQWRLSGVFIVNFEHIWHLVLVLLLF